MVIVIDEALRAPGADSLSRLFRMSAAIFFPADFQLSVERAGRRCNDIAAQNTKLLSPVMKLYPVRVLLTATFPVNRLPMVWASASDEYTGSSSTELPQP